MRPLMVSLLPAPSMTTVLSLSILTFLARPRSVRLTFSSWMPRSSKMALPLKKGDRPHLPERPFGCFAQMGPVPFFEHAGEDGDVFEHGLAAVAVAGGLDGGGLEGAADL